jgi:hypothetical protein
MATDANSIVGGWDSARVPTEADLKIFKQATARFVGARLDPHAVQSQVVNGTRYCFFSISTLATLHPVSTFVRVMIYAPLKGDPVLETIEHILACHEPNSAPGGWSNVHVPGEVDIKEFNEAMAGWTGVNYQPHAVQSQVVAGVNQCFFCIGTIVYKDPSSFVAAVNIYTAPGRKGVVTGISTITPW